MLIMMQLCKVLAGEGTDPDQVDQRRMSLHPLKYLKFSVYLKPDKKKIWCLFGMQGSVLSYFESRVERI